MTDNSITDTSQETDKQPVSAIVQDTPTAKLTSPINHLINDYVNSIENRQRSSTPIHVDEIASRLAKFYELIRKVIDWKEDSVLRRSATERILKRLIFTKIAGLSFTHGLEENKIAEIVTLDLIRGGHLPNNEVARELIPELALSLKKYFWILEHTAFNDSDPLVIKKKINFYTFIVEITACEVEEILTNPVKANSLILSMSVMLNDLIHIIPENAMTPEDKYTQVYISVCRTLYDLDDSFITYHLFKHQYAQWRNPSQEFIDQLQKQIFDIWRQTEKILTHPLSKNFNSICEQLDTVFLLLDDFMEEYKTNPGQIKSIIHNKDKFIELFGKYYDKRYDTLKNRLFKLGIFSTLSVFLSNSFTFFLVEIPMAEFFYEGFNLFTTLIDFIVPTAVMFMLVMIIRPPAADNKKRVLDLTANLIYEDGNKYYKEIFAYKKRNRVLSFIVGLLYIVLTVSIFWGIGSIFYFAGLPFTSVIFDTFTIALTIFAAVMIRNKSKELAVDEKTHLWDFLLDMISVPIAKIGSFLAGKWKEYNIIAIFFNFVVETPFALFLDFIENWSQFLKDRRAELH